MTMTPHRPSPAYVLFIKDLCHKAGLREDEAEVFTQRSQGRSFGVITAYLNATAEQRAAEEKERNLQRELRVTEVRAMFERAASVIASIREVRLAGQEFTRDIVTAAANKTDWDDRHPDARFTPSDVSKGFRSPIISSDDKRLKQDAVGAAKALAFKETGNN